MKEDDEAKFDTMLVAMFGMVILALMILCFMHCQSSDAKKAECIKETHDAYGCDCMFSSTHCDAPARVGSGSAK